MEIRCFQYFFVCMCNSYLPSAGWELWLQHCHNLNWVMLILLNIKFFWNWKWYREVFRSYHGLVTSNSFIHSFISLFSIYPYTGKTNDVEMVVIDVEVSVRRYHKWYKIMQVKTQHLLLCSGNQVNDNMFRPMYLFQLGHHQVKS